VAYRTSMASRVGLVATLVLATAFVATATATRQPATGTAMFVVRNDPRLCPSPLCGGYWAALANAARTRCQDGLRRPRCYAAVAVDSGGRPVSNIPEGALVRGAIDIGRDDLGELAVAAIYAPSGHAQVSGGYYRVRDTGIRCVRAPCFSYQATQANGSTGTRVSGVDLGAAKVTAKQLARASAALRTKDGLYARGRLSTGLDGSRTFHALRLYLRLSLPRA
jgi:hypothetical protein